MKNTLLVFLLLFSFARSISQSITASFNSPDTVCINSPVNIQNTSQGASNYFWNFCTANINQSPTGTNLGNVGGLLKTPVYMDYVFTNGNYYGFVTNNYPGGLLRLDFGNSLLNIPAVTSFGDIGGAIPNNAEGVQIANDNGNWYVLVVGGDITDGAIPSLTTVSLGTNIANNNPTATNWGNIGNLAYPHDLYVFNDKGNWYGLTVNYSNSTITLFDLTTSLSNTPSATNLGNIGNLSGPTGIQALNDNGNWRVFVTNATSSSLTRLDFGSSLLNTPTGVNLGNPNNTFVTCWDIYVLRYCGESEAFIINADGNNDIVKLDFGSSLLNNPTAASLGNQGNLSFPHSISKLFRVGADVFSFVTNVNNNTLSLLEFKGCTNASIPNSAAQNPQAITYNTPGVYNVNLTVDDGLPTQTSYCKQIVVQDCSNASIIINEYTPAVGFDICKNNLTVVDATKYNAGDTVLLIQMKGAVADTSNTAAFGNIIDYKNAGNYEFNIVKLKTGNVLGLLNRVQRQYDIPTGKVQLVRVPYYQSVTFNNNVTCLPWDGSKGGVVVFNVQNSLTLNADIDVTGKGFNGGNGIHANPATYGCYENQFYYPPNPDLAAGKGESIAIVSSLKSNGKGKIANGGGGGNSHNSGGGGGSNAVTGGFGGYEFEGAPCDGTTPFDNRGIGGAGLIYNNAAIKIFLGGGGGAGHANNPDLFYPNGGNGGGICIISANAIDGNNHNILASGDDGLVCSGYGATGCHEGMGGGGGAGTILLNINNYNSIVNTIAKGGGGADMVQGGNLRVGPGGGGGGGIIWFNNATVPANTNIDVMGGINGVCTNYSNTSFGTTPGQPGISLFNLNIPIDNVLFKPNIDSVRITGSPTSCNSFDFKGLGFTNTSAIASWKWSFGDGGNAATQNPSHTYASSGSFPVKLVVTDVNSCTDSISIPVISSNISITKSNDTTLCGSGPVQLSAAGGTSYSWAPSSSLSNAGISNPVATPLATTTYYVTVTNSLGCSRTDSIKITVSAPPVITKSNDTSVCKSTIAQLLAAGGTTYLWSPAGTLSNTAIPNPTATPATSTVYYVKVTNASGCATSDSVSVMVKPSPLITTSNDTTICNQASVQLFVSGGTSYVWSPSSSLDNAAGNSPVATPPGTTIYSVNITDANSCTYKDSVIISVKTPPVFTVSPDLSVCIGTSKQLQASGGDTYSWSPSTGLSDPTVSNPVVSPSSTTAYTVTIHENTCNQTGTLNTTLTALSPPGVNALSANDISCTIGSSRLSATGAANYSWVPMTGLNNTNIANPVANPSTTTVYTVTGKDINGCTNSDTVTVKVNFSGNALFLLPNSFTPNGDGLNDCFGVKYWGAVQELDFSIYNRFGEKVFHTSDPASCWNGTFKQKPQDANVFVYIIKAKTPCGIIDRKGIVTLVR